MRFQRVFALSVDDYVLWAVLHSRAVPGVVLALGGLLRRQRAPDGSPRDRQFHAVRARVSAALFVPSGVRLRRLYARAVFALHLVEWGVIYNGI